MNADDDQKQITKAKIWRSEREVDTHYGIMFGKIKETGKKGYTIRNLSRWYGARKNGNAKAAINILLSIDIALKAML